MKFRKKPVEIEAMQLTKESFLDVWHFLGGLMNIDEWDDAELPEDKCEMVIKTLEGKHTASQGDWIIKGVKGEFYPCKPDIFKLTYTDGLVCPFCGEEDFDLSGLKGHFLAGYCDVYNGVKP